MSNDVRTDIGSDYSFRVEASDAKRVRVLNVGPDSVYYDVAQEVSVVDGTEIEVGASVDFATPQWVISAGSSRAYLYHYEWDDIVDSFEIRGGGSEDEDFVFKPDGIEEGDSIEWDGVDWVPTTYTADADISGKQDAAAVLASGFAYVFHAADDDVARPTGFAGVFWVGSVEPTLAVDNDVWIDTS